MLRFDRPTHLLFEQQFFFLQSFNAGLIGRNHALGDGVYNPVQKAVYLLIKRFQTLLGILCEGLLLIKAMIPKGPQHLLGHREQSFARRYGLKRLFNRRFDVGTLD